MSTLILANLSAFTKAYSHSDLFGKLIILGLVLLSAICWLLLIQKIRLTKKTIALSKQFKKTYQARKDNILTAEFPSSSNPFASIFSELKTKTIEILNKNLHFGAQETAHLSISDLDIIEAHTLSTLATQTKRLEHNLFILSTIITLAPFLGLLGTVWGILVTFGELGGGASATSNMAILGGLSTALATTVLGLIIAIPALISYNYLKNTIRHYSSDMEEFLYDLLSTVEIQYRKVDTQ